MKLSKVQIEYIESEQARMDARMEDLDTFGDDIYKSEKLSAERRRIHYDRWLFNHMLKLHNIQVNAELAADATASFND